MYVPSLQSIYQNIWKVQKTSKIQNAIKNNRQIPKNKIVCEKRICGEIYRVILINRIWGIFPDSWNNDCKIWVWPTLGCKVPQSDPIAIKLALDMLCQLLNVYIKFPIDISMHIVKYPENSDGKTGVQTSPRHDITVFQRGVWKSVTVKSLI